MRTLTLLPIIALCACQQMPAPQVQSDASEVLKRYCRSAWASPELDPIRSRIPSSPEDSTTAQLSDPHKASPVEAQAIAKIDSVMAACHESTAKLMGREYGARVETIYREYGMRMRAERGALAAGSLTFGQYNTKAAEVYYTSLKEAQAIASTPPQPSYHVQPYVAPIYTPPVQVQPYFVPTYRSRQTNCTTVGNYTNCTTY